MRNLVLTCAAFGTGVLLSVIVLLNGLLAVTGTVMFSSWVPHLTGTLAAIALVAALRPPRSRQMSVPWWAYLGGVSGGVTVMLTSAAVNSPLALSGTIALGLAGQMVFGLVADARGLFGLPRALPTMRDVGAIGLIGAGALVLIYLGGA